MEIDLVLKEQIRKIRPSDSEIKKLENLAKELVGKLKKEGLKAYIGGSLAKGTLVRKEKQDIDIFVVFDGEDEIPLLEKILKKLDFSSLSKIHGSRDYFQIDYGDFFFEIIPVVDFKKSKEILNSTDISLLHVNYVLKKVRENPKVADEIRLAKSFCAANRVYGAESHVKGFSGYAIEILVIYFGSFIGFLKGIQKKRFVDIENYFKSESEAKRELNYSKINSPLIVIDPVYKYRNICAGLSKDTFDKFISVSKDFLKNPSEKFFSLKDLDVDKMKRLCVEKGYRLVELELFCGKKSANVCGGKMRKFFDFLCKELKRKKQEVISAEFIYEGAESKAKGYVVLKENKKIEIKGPPIIMKEASINFKKGKKKVYEKDGFFYSVSDFSIESFLCDMKDFSKEMSVKLSFKILV